MKRLFTFLMAMLWASGAQGVPSNATEDPRWNSVGYSLVYDEDSGDEAAGTYVIGLTFPWARVGIEYGGNFAGTLHACDTKTVVADTCDQITEVSGDVAGKLWGTERRWYVIVVTTAETSSTTTIRIRGTHDQISDGGGNGLPANWPTSLAHMPVIRTWDATYTARGAGWSTTGSVWDIADGDCDAVATNDSPCTFANNITSTIVPIAFARAQWRLFIDFTFAAGNGTDFYCRDDSTFVHTQPGAGTSIVADAAAHETLPHIYRDHDGAVDGGELYRFISGAGGGASGYDCAIPAPDLEVLGELAFPLTTDDDMMLNILDGTHPSVYGSRWIAQEMLLAVWEDQYPEVVGQDNIFVNGYGEANCTTAWTEIGVGTIADFAPNPERMSALNGEPIIGNGCRWTGRGVADVVTSENSTAVAPGEWIDGSVAMRTNSATATSETLTIDVIDQGGASIPDANIQWWVTGAMPGRVTPLEDVEGAGALFPVHERMCLPGCIFFFTLLVPTGVSDLRVTVLPSDDAGSVSLDELWAKRMIVPGFNRTEHYIIADGHAEFQLFTDSRGSLAATERLAESIDYHMGETTAAGLSRPIPAGASSGSIRPLLFLDQKPSLTAFIQSGARIGSLGFDWDDNEIFAGTAAAPLIANTVQTKTTYCPALFGVNDALGKAGRPNTSALNSDTVANRNLYFGDQVEGYLRAMVEKECIPIWIMEQNFQSLTDTSTGFKGCADDADADTNCGFWWHDVMDVVLHNKRETGN